MAKKEKKQRFEIVKRLETSKKTYEVGDFYETNHENVINFLRTHKYIK